MSGTVAIMAPCPKSIPARDKFSRTAHACSSAVGIGAPTARMAHESLNQHSGVTAGATAVDLCRLREFRGQAGYRCSEQRVESAVVLIRRRLDGRQELISACQPAKAPTAAQRPAVLSSAASSHISTARRCPAPDCTALHASPQPHASAALCVCNSISTLRNCCRRRPPLPPRARCGRALHHSGVAPPRRLS